MTANKIKKAGRMKKNISVNEETEALRKIAEKEIGINFSALIRVSIRDYMQRNYKELYEQAMKEISE